MRTLTTLFTSGLACVLVGVASVSAQPNGGSWARPYRSSVPGYWENVSLDGIGGGPTIDAFGVVAPHPAPGERVALVAALNVLLDSGMNPTGSTIGALAELRFVGADTTSASFEVRYSDGQSSRFSKCFVSRLSTYSRRPDQRYQVLSACAEVIQWGNWQPLRFALSGFYRLAPGGTKNAPDALPLAFSVKEGVLEVAVIESGAPR